MMEKSTSKPGKIRRYTPMIEKPRWNQNPTFGEIKDYLFEHGFEISTRTSQRDITQIRVEIGIEIKYSHSGNGSSLDEECSIHNESFLRFLETVNTAALLTESLKESKDTLHYISFASRGDLRGIEHLKPLLFAMKNHKKRSFTQKYFVTGKQRKFTVQPYLLKEYPNRWYIAGSNKATNERSTFDTERMRNLEVTQSTFRAGPKMAPLEWSESTIGRIYSFNSVEEVVLFNTPFHAKYLKYILLNQVREIIEHTRHEVRVKLSIHPNHEFKQKILMLGENIKVSKPKCPADDTKNSFSANFGCTKIRYTLRHALAQ
jgi:predicted DNA-binding transcriptional regulator YafY